MNRLQDRVALITGAGAGIGKGVARRFAAEGASLWLADINADTCARVAAEIRDEFGVQVGHAVADVSEHIAVQSMVDAALARFGPLPSQCRACGSAGAGGAALGVGSHVAAWPGELRADRA